MKNVFTSLLLLLALHSLSQQTTVAKMSGLGCNILGSFSTGTSGWGLDNEGSEFWVSLLSYYDKLFKFDTFGNKIDSVSVPFFGSGASYGDIEVSGNNLWVVNESSSELIKINLSTGNTLLQTTLPPAGGFDENYFSVVFDGTFLWVWNYWWPTTNKPRLFKLDPATHDVLDSVDVSSSSGQVISVIELIGNEIWGICPTQCSPFRMFQINTTTGALTDSSEWCIGFPPTPYGMAWDGSYLWQIAGSTVHKIDINPSGVSEPGNHKGLLASPNPAASTIEFSTGGMTGWMIIQNAWGKEVERIKLDGANIAVSVTKYPAGVYIAQMQDGNAAAATAIKFIVQHSE